jgi:Predicted phosphoesterase or phosphohydrolase
MATTFLISDTHFGHRNVLNFEKEDGTKLRNFSSTEEMDETLITNWNSVVRKEDKIYHLGDVVFRNPTYLDQVFSRLNGIKVLVKGNHDIYKLYQYSKWFKDIRGSHILDRYILTHIPIHPESLSRWEGNIHGHLHHQTLDDPRYYNVSVERINYTPIALEEIKDFYDHRS